MPAALCFLDSANSCHVSSLSGKAHGFQTCSYMGDPGRVRKRERFRIVERKQVGKAEWGVGEGLCGGPDAGFPAMRSIAAARNTQLITPTLNR